MQVLSNKGLKAVVHVAIYELLKAVKTVTICDDIVRTNSWTDGLSQKYFKERQGQYFLVLDSRG